ncbi:MAG TPA: hypothetical protein VF322_01705 [Gammaproteobacteria bacterium]
MSYVWYYRFGRLGSIAYLLGSACVIYVAILGLGSWLTVSLYRESSPKAILVAVLSVVAAVATALG